jgi:hypothetical protein
MRLLTVRLLVLSTVLLLAGGAATGSARPSRVKARPSRAKTRLSPIKIIVGAGNTVAPVLDASRSTAATIGATGGTLSTTAQNGTTLELKIPQGALAGSEKLTMTPIQSMAHGGVRFIAGVQLAPDGLELLKAAELDVHPARRTGRSGQVALGYEGTGSQFGLVPLSTRSAVAIPITTLGGFGLATATRGQISRRAHNPPSDPGAAFLQQLAIPLHQVRNRRSVHSNRRTVKGLLAAFYTGYVKPLLRSPGASNAAWSEAAGRGLFWSDEVQALGYGRQFPGYTRKYRRAVFNTALRHQWGAITGGCAVRRTLGALKEALVLARTAQALNRGSNIGGSAAIAAGLESCGALNLGIALNPTTVNWQSGLGSSRISQINTGVQIASTPLALEQMLGTNQFTFSSAHAAVAENINSVTLSPTYAAQGCTKPTLAGFTTDAAQMYGAFAATLTVPADLFVRTPAPPSTLAVTVAGADLASWTTTCPPGHTISFSQSPGAMSGLTAVTALTPVRVSSTTTSSAAKFQGSADILAANTITGFANGNGKVTVTVAH